MRHILCRANAGPSANVAVAVMCHLTGILSKYQELVEPALEIAHMYQSKMWSRLTATQNQCSVWPRVHLYLCPNELQWMGYISQWYSWCSKKKKSQWCSTGFPTTKCWEQVPWLSNSGESAHAFPYTGVHMGGYAAEARPQPNFGRAQNMPQSCCNVLLPHCPYFTQFSCRRRSVPAHKLHPPQEPSLSAREWRWKLPGRPKHETFSAI